MPLERSRQLIGGVWRYVSADQSDNGGSQPFKALGTITAASLVNGPATLHTPSGTDFVALYIESAVDLTEEWQINFDPFDTNSQAGGGSSVYFYDHTNAQDQFYVVSHHDSIPGIWFASIPVTAVLTHGGTGNKLLTAAGTWAAGHAYVIGNGIIDGAGHVQIVTVAGTSGGSLPTFDDLGGTTSDGGVTWQDNGMPPTVGSVTLVGVIGTPA